MKKAFFLIFVLFICADARAQSGKLTSLDINHGFKDITLGDTVPAIAARNLTFVTDNHKGLTFYKYKDTSANNIGGRIPLASVFVAFYMKKVYSINLAFEKRYGDEITDYLISQYGKSIQPNEGLKRYYWYGQRATLLVKYDPLDTDNVAIFTDKKLNILYGDKTNKERGRAGTGDN